MTVFYRDPRMFVLAVLMIVAGGLSAFTTIGRQEDPTITNLFATILTPFPGADPARVEALVTEKIEQELRQIPEIDNIISTSRSGISVIQVELSQFISSARIEQTWSEIRDALRDAARNLPRGLPEPQFDNDRTGAYTTISAITMAAGRATQPALMRRTAELLQDRLRGIAGTKLVTLFGAREEELRVVVEPMRLTEIGLTPQAVAQAISRADTKVSAGDITGSRETVLIEVAGEIRSLDRIRDVPLISGNDGRVVRIGDVARIERTVREPAQSLAIVNGRPAILIAARMQDDLQVHTWSARVRGALAEFERDLPDSLAHELLFDQSSYTELRLLDVMVNMAIGVALVVGVLFVTLGWRAAIVVASVLPLATLMSIFGLQASGISIHQMSVTGLIVALGLLVDAAIVMTDDIRRRLEAGLERLEAVSMAIRRLAVPLLASTVTTALAFTPMVLLPGPAGDFVGSIAIAVIIMLFSSLLLAVTLTPALAGWLLRPRASHKEDQRGERTLGKAAAGGSAFRRSVAWSVAHPWLSIMFALVLPTIGFGSFPTLRAQFFPGVDRDQLYIQVKLPDGAAIDETARIAGRIDDILEAEGGIRQLVWVIGENAPPFYYNMIANSDQTPSFAEALVTTESPQRTEELIPLLQRRLDAEVPDARITVRGLVQGPPVNAPLEIRIVGPNLATLRDLADTLRAIMIQEPDVLQAQTQMVGGSPKLSIVLDEARLRLAGLTLADAADQLETGLRGVTGGSLIEKSEELPVRVRVDADTRASFDAVADLNFMPPEQLSQSGASTNSDRRDRFPGLPLTAVGELFLEPSQAPIFRRNGERINTVQGFVHRDVLPEEALRKVMARIDEAGIVAPEGYRFEVGGDADARDDTITNLLASLGLIAAATLATIVLTFGSYRLTAISLVVVVLSVGLSILALALFQYPFGIQAVIGVIGSIGVSINAAIIILTALQEDENALSGDLDRIADLVIAQSRHILSTTVTTFGGFLPLILGGGGFWPPFAMAIAGGVLLSTVISFYFTPAAFAILARKGRLLSTKRNATPQVRSAPLTRNTTGDARTLPAAVPARP
ncbi:MAG: efflux RND transporter permease subunit [Hyphomicrobiaceae bacterium]